MANNNQKRKKDSARVHWDTKPRRAPNPKDIEFQTAEVVIPNPQQAEQLPLSFRDGLLGEQEIDKQKINRLIWGDNLLAMQALLSQGYEGKINLIYIDPPFDSKADYSHKMTIEGNEFTKEPSVIERLAYKDTWAGGIDSYLDMIYPRLQLMKRLLTEDGSILVHIDWHIGHYVKTILDEIFGRENFINEIIRQKTMSVKAQTQGFGNLHDTIFIYCRSQKYKFIPQVDERSEEARKIRFPEIEKETGRRFVWDNFTQAGDGPVRRFGNKILAPPPGKHWIWTQGRIDEGWGKGIIQIRGNMPRLKRYETKGVFAGDLWVGKQWVIHSQSSEDTKYDTQKPFSLIERCINAFSVKADLIADLFCGSGTTLVVAEKLGRQWIGCELGKVGIQVTRARLVEQRAKPFLIENIGNYQREMIYLTGGRIWEMQHLILKLYSATPRDKTSGLGVRRADDVEELVYVGYPDRPITAKKAEELAVQARKLDGRGYKRLVILGWDYEYNYHQALEARKNALKDKLKVHIESRGIPPDIYDYLKKAKTEDDVESLADKIRFYERPYLRLDKPEIKELGKDKVQIKIAIKRYVLMDIPVSHTSKKEQENYNVLMKLAKDNFAVLIDYWAIDWNYDGFTFKSQWQAFRGNGKKAKTVPIEATETLEKRKKRTIAVRVVDIFGNDAGATIEV